MTQQDQYIAQVLQKYTVQTGPQSPAVKNANAIAPTVQQWAGQWLDSLFLSGSYAKGTAVRGSTDVDLFISLKADTPSNLQQIYESLFQKALGAGWSPRRQNVSIGIRYGDTKIDLVPGRIQPGYQNYHSLWRNKATSWTQTNVALQIDKVKESQRTNEIRAVKIWRNLNNLDFPSFYLELTVINALYRRSTETLAENVWQSLQYIADSFPGARVVDPSNTNNVISDDLTDAEKALISSQARRSLQATNWGSVIY